MARRSRPVEPPTGTPALLATRAQNDPAALAYLRSSHGPPSQCTVADHLEAVRSQAAALWEAEADHIVGVITAVLDGLSLTGEVRARGCEIAAAELRRIAGGTAR